MSNKITAIVLARGGSKGIPRKNVLDFMGKPLVAWSIVQARVTPEIDDVYLSSDCDEILGIGKQYGAKIIKRPAHLADDTSKSELSILHALENISYIPEAVIMLEPTAPLRKPDDLSKAIRQFRLEKLDSFFSGAELEDFLIWRKQKDGILNSINYDYKVQGPRQLREPDYVENGAIYMFKPEVVLSNHNRFGGKIGIYMMDFWQSFEIDSPPDWVFVQMIFDYYLIKQYKNLLTVV